MEIWLSSSNRQEVKKRLANGSLDLEYSVFVAGNPHGKVSSQATLLSQGIMLLLQSIAAITHERPQMTQDGTHPSNLTAFRERRKG